ELRRGALDAHALSRSLVAAQRQVGARSSPDGHRLSPREPRAGRRPEDALHDRGAHGSRRSFVQVVWCMSHRAARGMPMLKSTIVFVASVLSLLAISSPHAAEYMEQGERIKGRSYSPAVLTEGGRIVWLAGETATTDLSGKDIKGDFEAQVRTVF